MSLLPFGILEPHKPRRFVPSKIDLGNWAEIAVVFEKLSKEADQCSSLEAFEQWLLNWSEVNAVLDEESSKRYIAMTCHTENSEAEKAYLHFVENIEPHVKPKQFELAKKFVAHPLREKLPVRRYGVFDRDTRLHVELFREENVPLETEEAKLSQQYQKLSGSLTVPYKGKEQTLTQMARYLEETDRELRQETWSLAANRRLQEKEKFEGNLRETFAVTANHRRERRLPQLPRIRIPKNGAVRLYP